MEIKKVTYDIIWKNTLYLWHENINNRVYLCWEDTNFEKPTTYLPINGFKCYRYNTLQDANCVWNLIKKDYEPHKLRHVIIPMNKFIPEIFDKYIVDYKLKKKFWLNNHTFGQGRID